MTELHTQLDASSDSFKANAEAMAKLVAELREKTAQAALGGNERAREKHLKRGKLLSRDRVQRLLDPGSPFLELSALAANDMYEGDVHGAGMITGIEYSNRIAAYVGETVTAGGTVMAYDEATGRVTLEVFVKNASDEVLTPGVITAQLTVVSLER